MEMFATIARSSFDGLNTGTGRADTSTGDPVRGLRAMVANISIEELEDDAEEMSEA